MDTTELLEMVTQGLRDGCALDALGDSAQISPVQRRKGRIFSQGRRNLQAQGCRIDSEQMAVKGPVMGTAEGQRVTRPVWAIF